MVVPKQQVNPTIERNYMKSIGKYVLAGVFALTLAVPAFAGTPTESDEINNLGSSDERAVFGALKVVEKDFPTDAAVLAKVKGLLADPREKIRAKAGRVL